MDIRLCNPHFVQTRQRVATAIVDEMPALFWLSRAPSVKLLAQSYEKVVWRVEGLHTIELRLSDALHLHEGDIRPFDPDRWPHASECVWEITGRHITARSCATGRKHPAKGFLYVSIFDDEERYPIVRCHLLVDNAVVLAFQTQLGHMTPANRRRWLEKHPPPI